LSQELIHETDIQNLNSEKMLTSIARELRASLTAILGFGALLNKTPLDRQQKTYLESMLKDGTTLLDLVDNMTLFSLLDQERNAKEAVDFDLDFLVNDVFRMADRKCAYRPVSKYVDITRKFSCLLKGDPVKLRKVLFNLLDNAIKLTKRGEIGVSVNEIEDDEVLDDVVLRFTVKDTSGGMDLNKQNEIESLFNRPGGLSQYDHDGMSLMVCKTLVESMGGKIWVETKAEEGNSFSFTVPLQQGKKISQEGNLQGRKIVIIEGSQGAREVVCRYCEEYGAKILSAVGSVEEAFEEVEQLISDNNSPEIILSDVVLAGTEGWMYGYELIKKVQEDERWKNMKIIAMTSDIRYGAVLVVEEEGFHGYLAKPFSRKELLKAFEDMLKAGQKNSHKDSVQLSGKTCSGLKVLVVEDSSAGQRLIEACFNVLGCEGDYANDGIEAIEKLKMNQYDMCLMDIMMPRMNGIEATKIIRQEISKNFPIVALTAASVEISREICLNAGMNDYMTKPVDILKLEEKIVQYGKLSR